MRECKKMAQIKGEISICLPTPLSLILSHLMKRHVKCSLSVQMLFGVIVYVQKIFLREREMFNDFNYWSTTLIYPEISLQELIT